MKLFSPNKTIFLFLSLVAFVVSPTQKTYAGWIEQNSGVTTLFYDIFFLDSLHGWAAGDSSTIISTMDGGDTWIKLDCPEGYGIKKIYFIDENIGFAIGDPLNRKPAEDILPSVILKTINGGISWQIKNTGINDFIYINNITVIDESRIWATGRSQEIFPGYIVYSSDGGDTWEINHTEENWVVYDVEFLNENVGFAAGAQPISMGAGEISKTVDGGKTWTFLTELNGFQINNVYPVSQDTLYAWGTSYGKSTDGGLTWTRISTPSIFGTMDFIDDDTYWVYCRNTLLRFTDDGGQTFSDVHYPDKNTQFRAMAAASNSAWLVGIGGKLVKYTDDTVSGVNTDSSPSFFEIKGNYPNPFNPNTTISFSLTKNSPVEIAVYNIEGQKIKTLFSGVMSAGNHSSIWDGRNETGQIVSSGIYFARLKSGNVIENHKMLLLR